MQVGRRSPGKRRNGTKGGEPVRKPSFLHLVPVGLPERPRFARHGAELGLSSPTVPPPHTEEQGGDAPPFSTAVPPIPARCPSDFGSSHHNVPPAVKGQVVGAGEAAVTVRAAEGLDACVLAEVPGQLIGAGELPGAAFPGAFVGLLACARGAERGQHCKNYCHAPCRAEKKPNQNKKLAGFLGCSGVATATGNPQRLSVSPHPPPRSPSAAHWCHRLHECCF